MSHVELCSQCHLTATGQVAMASLSTYHCIDIYGTWYKSSDLSITCYDSEWGKDAAIAMFGIVMSPLRAAVQ